VFWLLLPIAASTSICRDGIRCRLNISAIAMVRETKAHLAFDLGIFTNCACVDDILKK
jgi:hypothetical protein